MPATLHFERSIGKVPLSMRDNSLSQLQLLYIKPRLDPAPFGAGAV